jgi:hypothetical protein
MTSKGLPAFSDDDISVVLASSPRDDDSNDILAAAH